MKICSCLNKGVMIAVAVVCSAGLQSCLDDNDKYYYVGRLSQCSCYGEKCD